MIFSVISNVKFRLRYTLESFMWNMLMQWDVFSYLTSICCVFNEPSLGLGRQIDDSYMSTIKYDPCKQGAHWQQWTVLSIKLQGSLSQSHRMPCDQSLIHHKIIPPFHKAFAALQSIAITWWSCDQWSTRENVIVLNWVGMIAVLLLKRTHIPFAECYQ